MTFGPSQNTVVKLTCESLSRTQESGQEMTTPVFGEMKGNHQCLNKERDDGKGLSEIRCMGYWFNVADM